MSKAIVLTSGGLDSATVLAIAHNQGAELYALSFNYGQRHHAELQAAQTIARHFNAVQHKIVNLDLGSLGGSSLTDHSLDIPKARPLQEGTAASIPSTYVPARNTLFLSYALAWAEVIDARSIYIGVNTVDYSGYPDCRPAFIQAFETMANLATKAATEGELLTIHCPLIHLSKSAIIKQGLALGLDYSMTISCYQADAQGRACGQCESCYLRRQGFVEAGVTDPTNYQV